MARVKTIKKARQSKKERRCTRCSYIIQPGETYYSIAKMVFPRGGYTVYFCYNHYPKPSDILSGKQSDYARMHEEFDDAVGNATSGDDLVAALTDLESAVTEMSEEYGDSASNIEDGFGHSTYQSEMMESNRDNLAAYADEINNAIADVENNDDDVDDDDEDNDYDRLDELREVANAVLGNQPDLES